MILVHQNFHGHAVRRCWRLLREDGCEAEVETGDIAPGGHSNPDYLKDRGRLCMTKLLPGTFHVDREVEVALRLEIDGILRSTRIADNGIFMSGLVKVNGLRRASCKGAR